jgi:hypothetical protein
LLAPAIAEAARELNQLRENSPQPARPRPPSPRSRPRLP